MILKNANYLNADLEFKKGHILIEKDKIADIFDQAETCPEGDMVMDCSDYLVLPGLINAHTHNPATLANGLFRDVSLKDWLGDSFQGNLQKKLFRYLDEYVGSEAFRILSLKAYFEYLKQGITYIVESGQADNACQASADYLKEIGLKATCDLYETYEVNKNLESDSIQICAHIPEEEDIDDNWIKFCENLDQKYRPIFMTHCLETLWRRDLVKEKFNTSTVKLLAEHNLLNERMIMFHCVHVDEEDVDLIAEKGASIVYCPVSNLWSGAGEAPLDIFLRKKIKVLLGTDFIYQDIWEVMRMTYYMLKSKDLEGEFTAKDIFRMVTQNPNNRIGKYMNTGSIQEGNKADLILIDKEDTRLMPLIDHEAFSNVLHNILLNCSKDMIKNVMVNGEWVIRSGSLVTLDESWLNREYRALSKQLFDEWLKN